MKQGNKIVSYIVLLSIVFVVVLTASLLGLFRVSFKSIEKMVARKNLQFCLNSLQAEIKNINGLTFEWSAWDDCGMYIEGQKPNFIGENTSEILLREKKIDVLCILNTRGNILWSRMVRNSGNEYRRIELEMFSPENLKKNPLVWNHQTVNNCVSGFCSTEHGVLMLSARPVTSNTNSLPIHGTVIFGRFISDQVIADIARQTCLDFKWWNLKSDYTRQEMKQYVAQITPENPIHIEFEFGSAAAYTILKDISKQDAILIKFLMTDELAVYRDELMIKSIAVFFVAGFIFVICLTSIVNWICVKTFSKTSPVYDLPPDIPSTVPPQAPAEMASRNRDSELVTAGREECNGI